MLNNNNITEIWKDIENYEGHYQVSNLGRVRNKSKRIMKSYQINSGYLCLKLHKSSERSSVLIHRLVLLTFKPIEHPQDYEVNHLDEDKTNNALSNLEWCSSSENKQHSLQSGRYDKIFTMRNSLGKKHLTSTYSKYHNVTYDKQRGKWVAAISHQGRTHFQGRYMTEEEAAVAVNVLIDKLGLTDRPRNVII